MPKRRVRNLDGIRIELNERERDLIEQAIIVNGISGIARGLGNAIGGLGLAVGLVGAVLVWKEGADVVRKIIEKDRADWEKKNLTQAKYDAYINTRTEEWIKDAKRQGRYGPSFGDAQNTSWWWVLVDRTDIDPVAGVPELPLTFEDWEMDRYGEPPLLYDQWSNQQRAEATRERKRKLGYGFIQEWWEAAWAGGTWSPDQPVDRYS